MSQGPPKSGAVRFIVLIAGLTALAICTTIVIGYLVTSPPREFMFWVVVGFLSTVEFLAGILAINNLARMRHAYRPSGAVQAITYGTVGAFAVSGFISIIVYLSVRGPLETGESVFGAVMMGITVFWFIIAALLYAHDLRTQEVSGPTSDQRLEHHSYASSLEPILASIRAVSTGDDAQRKRLSVLTKRLETIEAALAHSHGGGIGSWERGQAHPSSPEQNQSIAQAVAAMSSIASRILTGTTAGNDSAIDELEGHVTALDTAVEALELT